MGSYKNWNIIEITPKPITFEAFDGIHKVVLDRISENMASLVQPGIYGAINTDEKKKILYYPIHIRGTHAKK